MSGYWYDPGLDEFHDTQPTLGRDIDPEPEPAGGGWTLADLEEYEPCD